nr:RHS repeat domain-containing protein [Prevotella fusca]
MKTPRRGLTRHPNHEVSEDSGTHIAWQTGDYAYEWYGNGMLKEVRIPYGKTVRFEYDALGRRTAKLFNGHVFRYLWDGNVMVQEWQYEEKDRPQHSIDEFGRIRMLGDEPVENLVTWYMRKAHTCLWQSCRTMNAIRSSATIWVAPWKRMTAMVLLSGRQTMTSTATSETARASVTSSPSASWDSTKTMRLVCITTGSDITTRGLVTT